MSQAIQALLPFLRGEPRTLRRSTSAPLTTTRVARPAVPLRHHAVQALAEQLELRFHPSSPAVYVHEGARQLLERRLSQASRMPVVVAITDNRHSMIHATRAGGLLRARIHHMFLDAPLDIVEALARFLVFKDRDASAVVGRYIEGNASRIRAIEPTRGSLGSRGTVHDLKEIFEELNARYFDGQVDARICWGREPNGASRGGRTTIKLGSYTAQERLIRIHPRLDQPFVPRYFVSFVVFHEMLHHAIPARRIDGRRVLHPAAFRDRERIYRHHERAVAWEREHLDRLLSA